MTQIQKKLGNIFPGLMIFYIGRSRADFLFTHEFRWSEAGSREAGGRRFKNYKTGLGLVAGEGP